MLKYYVHGFVLIITNRTIWERSRVRRDSAGNHLCQYTQRNVGICTKQTATLSDHTQISCAWVYFNYDKHDISTFYRWPDRRHWGRPGIEGDHAHRKATPV